MSALAGTIRAELRRVRDPAKVEPMRAYMKSEMPFLGVQARPLDYAWHDPRWVDRYVAQLGDRLSGLSRREATKNLSRLLG